MKPEEFELIRYRMNRAKEAGEEADLLLKNGYLRAAVNRLYYSCFYAVSALLLTERRSSSSHSGVMSLFDRYWIKPGRLGKEMGRFYRRLFERRQKGDYGDVVVFRAEDVETWVRETSEFIFKISEKIEEKERSERG